MTTRFCRFGVHLWDWAERKEKKTHDTNTSNDDVDTNNNDERVEGGGGNMTGKAFLGAFTAHFVDGMRKSITTAL